MKNKIKIKLKGVFYTKEYTNLGIYNKSFSNKVKGTFIRYENKSYWYINENLSHLREYRKKALYLDKFLVLPVPSSHIEREAGRKDLYELIESQENFLKHSPKYTQKKTVRKDYLKTLDLINHYKSLIPFYSNSIKFILS